MEQSRTKNVLRITISSLSVGFIGTLFPFWVRTYTIKYLGSEYMGLNNLCTSILAVLSITDLGVANAFAYRLYKPIAQGDKEETGRLLNFYRKVYFLIGMIILCAGMVILPFFDRFISCDVPDGVNIYAVFFIYLINTVVSYMVFAYKNLILTAAQRSDYRNFVTSISFIILYGGQIFLIHKKCYYASICILPICTILANIVCSVIVSHKYPDFCPKGNASKEEIFDLASDVFSVAVYKFRDISRNAFDNIVISAFAGLVLLADYQNYYMVFTVPIWLLTSFYASALPSIGNFAASYGREEVYGIYKKTSFVISILAGWFAICFGCLIQDFIVIWLGVEFQLSRAAAALFAVYIYIHGEAMIIKTMRESIGLWRIGRIWAAVEMLANLVLNVVLMSVFGIEGIILATIISMLFISIPIENRIIFNQYFTGRIREKIKSMLIYMMWTMLAAIATALLCSLAPDIQYVSFAYKVAVCAIVPPLVCVACFHRTEEFGFVKDTLMACCFRRT